jgi:hypothetical protein
MSYAVSRDWRGRFINTTPFANSTKFPRVPTEWKALTERDCDRSLLEIHSELRERASETFKLNLLVARFRLWVIQAMTRAIERVTREAIPDALASVKDMGKDDK